MARRIWSLGQSLLAGSFLSLVCIAPIVAQSRGSQGQLTEAEVCRQQRTVEVSFDRGQSYEDSRLGVRLKYENILKTASNSLAELLFNEGSIARVNQSSEFLFKSGLRRFDLENYQHRGCQGYVSATVNEAAIMTETIFFLKEGMALVMAPQNSVGTQIETPDSRINIATKTPVASASFTPDLPLATRKPILIAAMHHVISDMAGYIPPIASLADSGSVVLGQANTNQVKPALPTPDLLVPPEKSSAVIVVHNSTNGTTSVFALTDGDITVSDSDGQNPVSLLGGQTVAVTNGEVGQVREFNLQAFYHAVPLASGLAPGQEDIVAQEPEGVQITLNKVRVETLAALRRQQSKTEFLKDALRDRDTFFDEEYDLPSDNDGLTGQTSSDIINPVVTDGIFVRTGENTATFTDGQGNVTPMTVDFDDDPTITINGNGGISNDAGLSGNNASGTVINPDGTATRIEIFGVNGDEPPVNVPFQGTLTDGIAPDR
ncbi:MULTISPECIES: hypothetical protein [unclassified Moorena]|uniref:hypothetical protein n=1 Tax=unclassified Moorena TaxID=2683338 RepID=UPI0013CCAAC6|nr:MULTISPECIES: hypothetical protein [unclassified Moorena]NEO21988.1 hypothetical protein [Moorena sp. SIO4A5]NEQ61324.1 hypothetical protein [Moorena sp. SIO4A1]